jgi:hypothetical protein
MQIDTHDITQQETHQANSVTITEAKEKGIVLITVQQGNHSFTFLVGAEKGQPPAAISLRRVYPQPG